nr:GPN-loop GTPase 3-like [Tanacetum cinerariifolium]
LLIAQVCTKCKANLDPAAENFNYPLAMDILELISLKDVMDELKLGPTDGLVYCMEHFEEILDEWLGEELDNYMEDDYLVFDCQIVMFFHVPALKNFVEHLQRKNSTVCVVYMLDSQDQGKAKVKELMKETELTKQEKESKLGDEFDRCTLEKGEMIHSYYIRFVKLMNDINIIGLDMTPLQVNTKFVNHLQPKWSRFVTRVKQANNQHQVSFDQLYAYLKQNEPDANEVRAMKVRFPYPLALIANTYNSPQSYSSYKSQYNPPMLVATQQKPYIPQPSYEPPPVYQQPRAVYQQSPERPTSPDSGFIVPTFLPTDDLIASLNKGMMFLTTTISSRYLQTNNQLRTSSNLRNQANFHDGRVVVQNVQGRQTHGYTTD